jgi:hypothetical protein
VISAALGLEKEDLTDPRSGFRAAVYKVDPEVMNVPPKYIVSFRGTHDIYKDFVKANVPQSVGLESTYYNRAMLIGRSVAGKIANKILQPGDVEFTGHSLGGGLASAASVVSGIKATTQNAAGLHPKTVSRFTEGALHLDPDAGTRLVEAYRIQDADHTELLTALNESPFVPDAIGEPVPLGAPRAGLSSYDLHGIDAVIDSLEERKTKAQQTLSPR